MTNKPSMTTTPALGFRLVPVEATREMIEEGAAVIAGALRQEVVSYGDELDASNTWSAMLNASPSLPDGVVEAVAREIYEAMRRADDDEPWPSYDDNLKFAPKYNGNGNIYFNEANKAARTILSLFSTGEAS